MLYSVYPFDLMFQSAAAPSSVWLAEVSGIIRQVSF